MANVISGHISGQYGGPRSCDDYYDSRSSTSCATNPGDCSHTVVVGSASPIASAYTDAVYPDNTRIVEGAPYDGPLSCTSSNNCAFEICDPAEAFVAGSIFVNPGQCVELKFTLYERAGNNPTLFCRTAVAIEIYGATAPNLGVLTGYWFGYQDAQYTCCGQKDEYKLCTPEFNYNFGLQRHQAYLSYKALFAETLAYRSDTSTFCCQGYDDCPAGTPYVEPYYDGDCIEDYNRNCNYPGGGSGSVCIPDPDGFPRGNVAPPVVGPAYGTYLYCADQPCGAKIFFDPRYRSIVTPPGGTQYYYAVPADSAIFLDITGYPGCGVGCTAA